jgi:hypothetical protein
VYGQRTQLCGKEESDMSRKKAIKPGSHKQKVLKMRAQHFFTPDRLERVAFSKNCATRATMLVQSCDPRTMVRTIAKRGWSGLLQQHGVGVGTVAAIEAALARRGIKLAA